MSFLTKVVALYDQLPEKVRTVIWSAGRAFIGAELLLVPGLLAAPTVNVAWSLVMAGSFAAATGFVRAVQHGIQSYLGQS
jgi:hypothetical protein